MTMVRNDDFFLRKWVDYYASQLGRENLWIYFDGHDQLPAPDYTAGCNIIACEHIDADVKIGEKRRARLLSAQAAEILRSYDMVIGTDVDEFLVCDPALGLSLREFLSLLPVKDSASGLGIDVGQCLDSETRIDPSRPYLQQRRYAGVYPRYTKPSVMASPCRWGSGLHRIKGHNFHTVKDLYLFHFGGFDLDRIKEKMGDKELIGNGWGRHMHKRAATIHAVTETVRRGRVRPWCVTKTLRRLEQWLRPIFAVNKPTLLGHKAIVEIPQRFRDVL